MQTILQFFGSWSMFSNKAKIPTIKEVLEARLGKENIRYAKGSEILREKEINEILAADGGNLIHIENEEEKEKLKE